MGLYLQPVGYREACQFVRAFHRHHDPPQGHKFSIGVSDEVALRGVVMVGRPVARHFDDGFTVEVTRMCSDGTANACSMLYRAAWRAAKNMGYRRLITYTLKEERGSSLLASGFRLIGEAGGGSWNSKKRPRQPGRVPGVKHLWEIAEEEEGVRIRPIRSGMVEPQGTHVLGFDAAVHAGEFEVAGNGGEVDAEQVGEPLGGFGLAEA